MTFPSHQGRTFPNEPLTKAEIAALLRAMPTRSASGLRSRAALAVMYGGGLRISEALRLLPRDVDLDAATLRVRNGKGGRTASVGLDATSVGLLATWLERRSALGLNGREPVLCTYAEGAAGKPLDPVDVRCSLRRYGARAGIEKRVNPHSFRHAMATHMYEAGDPLPVIQRQLRHASLATTAAYISSLVVEREVAEAVERRTGWDAA